MSGPARTPTEILNMQGSSWGKRRKGEPKARSGKPKKPGWVTGEAAKVWRAAIAELESMGTLAGSDGAAIGRYCVLLVRWIEASKFLAKYGETYPYKDDQGRVKGWAQFPQVATVNKLSVLVLRLEQEFGLTPASRAGLCVNLNSSTPQVASRTRDLPRIVG
jgi:P27 family predicted phage terminase small subunit